jgi:hypothetical protein
LPFNFHKNSQKNSANYCCAKMNAFKHFSLIKIAPKQWLMTNVWSFQKNHPRFTNRSKGENCPNLGSML